MLVEAMARVRQCYDQPGRHYHNWDHVEDCLRKAVDFGASARAMLALLYHDAVYVPGRKDNEFLSAAMFVRDAKDFEIAGPVIPCVSTMILFTTHDMSPPGYETALVVDIDMSGLGESWETFQRNDANIRSEFSAFPDDQWIAGRAAFLRSLLAKDRIFYSHAFADHEAPARANIERKIAELTAQTSRPDPECTAREGGTA